VNPEEVAEKILRHSEALGGISRFTFQMNAASLPHAELMRAIEAIGTRTAFGLIDLASGDTGPPGTDAWLNAKVSAHRLGFEI